MSDEKLKVFKKYSTEIFLYTFIISILYISILYKKHKISLLYLLV